MRNHGNAARNALILCLALAGAVPAWSQAGPYVIKSVDFKVKGRSLAFVLRQKIEADGPVIGRSFEDEASLDAYIDDRRQVLINNRVLASVEASRTISPSAAGGSEVAIAFAVVDTWNLVALPQPKYDSNKGLTLYVKGRDYNFAGSMQTLNLDVSYVSDTASNKSFALSTSFALPFQAAGSEWSLGVSEDFQVWTDGMWKSGSSASINYNIPGLRFPASLSATQGVYAYPDAKRTDTDKRDPWYLGESLGFSASIPTGLNAGGLGGIYYTPILSVSQNWWPGTTLSVYGRQGLGVYAANKLGTGRVDWNGNMREGAAIQLSSENSYNLYYRDFIWTLSSSIAGYAQWDRWFGVAARLSSRARVLGNFPDDNFTDLGAEMRGILDARPGAPAGGVAGGIVGGVAGFYANLSVPVKLFDFPTHVIIKKNWLDFELQAQPFVDVGVVLPDWRSEFSSRWLWASGGLELLFFPAAIRSFIVRASIGWDLKSVIETRSLTASASDGSKPYEIYFVTGLAY